jgi:adenosylmethionine-8-amino-7-oxononanoate aminotransferase
MRGAPADQKFMHAATYSGHPACCAVGLRNVELIESEKLVERSALMGRRLLTGLEGLRDLPNVGDVRGLGMMCGIELVEKKETRAPAIGLGPRVAKEALSRGLIFRLRGGAADPAIGDTICIAPPLSTPTETLDRIPDIIRASIVAATK